MKKRKFSNYTVIFFSSVAVAALASLSIYLYCHKIINRTMGEIQRKYSESVDLLLDANTKYFNSEMVSFKNALYQWIGEKEFFEDSSPDQVQSYLKRNISRIPKDFHDIFYFDKSGNAYSIYGTVTPIKDRDYYAAVFEAKIQDYVSRCVFSKVTKAPIFIITHSVYDRKGNVKGALCASVNASAISERINYIRRDNLGVLSVIDQTGMIVAYSDDKFLYKNLDTDSSKYV